MKIRLNNLDSTVVHSNDTYDVIDNNSLDTLVVSKTVLHPDKTTRGHAHTGQEEIYLYLSGIGIMQVADEQIPVTQGNIVLIPDSAFHKVANTGTDDLVFISIFNGNRQAN
jgi:oxalate decarboxylase/phosphoglucose isomerase-like protein (cupin superfamily)